MNKLLKVFLVLCACSLSPFTNAQSVIAVVENSQVRIVVNKDTLIDQYEQNLAAAAQINASFTSVSVVKNDGDYILVFKGSNIKSSLLLNVKGNPVNGVTLLATSGKTSCTTSDCSSSSTECEPRTIFQGCTPCSKGKCTKTSSNLSMLGNLYYVEQMYASY